MLARLVRTAFAILAALMVAIAVAAPHVHHAGPYGGHSCQACVFRAAEAASSADPAVAPAEAPLGPAPREPGLSPVGGLPLGAVPGQSPPRA